MKVTKKRLLALAAAMAMFLALSLPYFLGGGSGKSNSAVTTEPEKVVTNADRVKAYQDWLQQYSATEKSQTLLYYAQRYQNDLWDGSPEGEHGHKGLYATVVDGELYVGYRSVILGATISDTSSVSALLKSHAQQKWWQENFYESRIWSADYEMEFRYIEDSGTLEMLHPRKMVLAVNVSDNLVEEGEFSIQDLADDWRHDRWNGHRVRYLETGETAVMCENGIRVENSDGTIQFYLPASAERVDKNKIHVDFATKRTAAITCGYLVLYDQNGTILAGPYEVDDWSGISNNTVLHRVTYAEMASIDYAAATIEMKPTETEAQAEVS